MRSKVFLTILLLVAAASGLNAQVSQGGVPAGLHLENSREVVLKSPELSVLLSEDRANGKNGVPERVGIAVEAATNILEEGEWTVTANGTRLCRMRFIVPGALALAPYFSRYRLPEGGKLFIYDPAGKNVLGAFTSANNRPGKVFSTQLIPGDTLIIEYSQPSSASPGAELYLDHLAYHYKRNGMWQPRGTSDYCEVNINCSPEGDNWQNQKRGIARIYVKVKSSYFWCTGTLVNNTRRDWTPYFLTANHCGQDATEEDYLQWVFYFKYEGEGCEDPLETPEAKSLTGATVVSRADEASTDFKLLLLQDEIPDDYDPYYNGWDRSGDVSSTGVTIHHPAGDVKKVSTYAGPLVSDTWNGTPGTHWKVVWSETPNGHGVTEGGSSGAPIFSSGGLVIGMLTGGRASCDPGSGGPGTGPDQPDYYGKVSYSWESSGNTPQERLSDWLDPDNEGSLTVKGINNLLTADFEATPRVILVGQSVDFANISAGTPHSFEWLFEGGVPATSTEKNPGPVRYEKGGAYDVTLVVTNISGSDTLVREDYVQVSGRAYPNPASSHITVYLGEEPATTSRVELYDLFGRRVYDEKVRNDSGFQLVEIDVSGLSSGIYIVRITRDDRFVMEKVMVSR